MVKNTGMQTELPTRVFLALSSWALLRAEQHDKKLVTKRLRKAIISRRWNDCLTAVSWLGREN